MKRNENWHSKIPADVKKLALSLVLALPVFPIFIVNAALSWVVGLLFFKACRIGALKTLPLLTHFNLIAIGVLLSIGQEWSGQIALTVSVASVVTLVVTTMMMRLFYFYWIPVLLLPALSVYGVLSYFHSDGLSVFLEVSTASAAYGMAIFMLASAVVSPVFLMMLGIGLVFGIAGQFLVYGQYADSLSLTLFQCIVFAFCASIAVMPSRRSIAWGGLAVLILTVCVQESYASLTTLSLYKLILSGNLACVVAIYGSRLLSQYRYISYRLRPEDKLEDQMTQWQRFRAGEARAGLPFKGTWKVSQGFEGAWTHRGIWRHGLDFVVTDAHGKTYLGNGLRLEDYYAFGKEVLSPTSGYVVAMFQDLPDNPVGTVKNQNNFGNYVIIRDAYGAHILLGHLKQGSVKCALYQYVEVNHVIAQCGNSGYSPEPHVHMHVQADAVAGSATIPFHITNYFVGGTYCFHGVPESETLVTKLEMNASLCRSLGFRVDECFDIVGQENGETTVTKIENKLDPHWGTMFFTDGVSKLFHYRDALTFYFYRYEGRREGALYDLMMSMPRVPLIYGVQCKYEDHAPVMCWSGNVQKWKAYFNLIFIGKFNGAKASFNLNCDILEVKGEIWSGKSGIKTSCFLDPVEGFVEFNVGERKYEVRSQREHGGVVSSNVDARGQSSGQEFRRIV